MYARAEQAAKTGIIAFVTNRSFIDSRTFDGFRKCINDEFSACYIIDTKSDVRVNPKIAGSLTMFFLQTGVLNLLVNAGGGLNEMDETQRKEVKLQWLGETKLRDIPFELIAPDETNNRLNHRNISLFLCG